MNTNSANEIKRQQKIKLPVSFAFGIDVRRLSGERTDLGEEHGQEKTTQRTACGNSNSKVVRCPEFAEMPPSVLPRALG
jgi:hypothetical protein